MSNNLNPEMIMLSIGDDLQINISGIFDGGSSASIITVGAMEALSTSIRKALTPKMPSNLEDHDEVRTFIEQLLTLDEAIVKIMKQLKRSRIAHLCNDEARQKLENIKDALADLESCNTKLWWTSHGDLSKEVLPTTTPGAVEKLKEYLDKI